MSIIIHFFSLLKCYNQLNSKPILNLLHAFFSSLLFLEFFSLFHLSFSEFLTLLISATQFDLIGFGILLQLALKYAKLQVNFLSLLIPFTGYSVSLYQAISLLHLLIIFNRYRLFSFPAEALSNQLVIHYFLEFLSVCYLSFLFFVLP